MPRAVKNLARELGLSEQKIQALTCDSPRKAIGILR